jgi:hypothetical protein
MILVLKVTVPMAVLVMVPGDFELLTVINLQKVKLDVTAARGGTSHHLGWYLAFCLL